MSDFEKEREKLKEVYNLIADSWSNLRNKPRIDVTDAKFSSPLLDVGCGNSRNLIPFLDKGIKCVGIDFSKSMIKQSKILLSKHNLSANLVIGDACYLPFKDSSFNSIISLATLHHIPSKRMRIVSLNEIKRISKNNSKIIISVWYRWQLFLLKHVIKSLFTGKKFDVYVEWNYHGRKLYRFYHLFSKKELESEIKESGLNIIKIYVNKETKKKNVIAICTK